MRRWNRPILIDIFENNLDPKKKYTSTDKHGKLKSDIKEKFSKKVSSNLKDVEFLSNQQNSDELFFEESELTDEELKVINEVSSSETEVKTEVEIETKKINKKPTKKVKK